MADPILEQIIAACQPYWQVRDNHIHIPASFAYAQRLVAHYPQADPLIVLPAILLHDNGYAYVPAASLFAGLAGSPIQYDLAITRLHEIEGAKIARTILHEMAFDPDRIAAICTIIDGHDTRAEALSLEDELVKDADKLWRFSIAAAYTAGVKWMNKTPLAFLDYCTSKIDGWFFKDLSKVWAREDGTKTRHYLVPPREQVAVILISNDQLLIKVTEGATPQQPAVCALLRGKLAEGETAMEALHRTVAEAVGVQALYSIPVCTLLQRADDFCQLHYFAVLWWEGEIQLQATAGLAWIALADFEQVGLDRDQQAIKEFRRVYPK